MHTHFYTIEGETPFEIGRGIGKLFAQPISEVARRYSQLPNWSAIQQHDHTLFTLTQQYFPSCIEELRGFAEGAKISLSQAWSLCIEEDSLAHEEENPAHCTSIVTNEGELVGHTEDAETAHDQEKLSVVRKRMPSRTTIELFYDTSLGGTGIGINSAGFIQEINTLYQCRREKGVPKTVISRYLLDTKDPQKDLEFLRTIPKASGYHHGILDRAGHMWNVEYNSSDERVYTKDFPFVHTNHCVFDPETSFPDEWGTQTRYRFAKQHVEKSMTVEEMQNLLQDTSCGKFSLNNQYTMAMMVIDLSTWTAWIQLRRESESGFLPYDLQSLL